MLKLYAHLNILKLCAHLNILKLCAHLNILKLCAHQRILCAHFSLCLHSEIITWIIPTNKITKLYYTQYEHHLHNSSPKERKNICIDIDIGTHGIVKE